MMLATSSLRPTSLRIRNTFLEVAEVSSASTPTDSPRPVQPLTTPAAFAPLEVFASTVLSCEEVENPIASPSPLRCAKRKQPDPVKYVTHSMNSTPELHKDAANHDGSATQATCYEEVSSAYDSPVSMIATTPTPLSGETAQKIKLEDFITSADVKRSISMPENVPQQQVYFQNMNMNQLVKQQEPCATQALYELDEEQADVHQAGDCEDLHAACPAWEAYGDASSMLHNLRPRPIPRCSAPVTPAPGYLPPVVTPEATTVPPRIPAAVCKPAGPTRNPQDVPYSSQTQNPMLHSRRKAPPAAPAPKELNGDTRALLFVVLKSKNPLGVQAVLDHARHAGLTPKDVRHMLGTISGNIAKHGA